ncbi:MAG: hypothetical protein IPI24_13385 [Ignavibacteria bacterium]|nr:hypothetical protein [Ignavibacteria bacterium]
MVGSSGSLVASKRNSNVKSLTYPGQSFPIEQGEPFTLDVPELIDLGTHSLVVSETDSVSISGKSCFRVSLKESCSPYIVMDKKCKVINWYNPYRLPEVRVKSADEQLIMTPLLDRNEDIMGYEVRLGDSVYDKCASPALEELTRVRKKREGKNRDKIVVRKPADANKPVDIVELFDFRIGS